MKSFPPVDPFTSILPNEIVEHIFLLCRPPRVWGDDHLPLTNVPLLLSHVCKAWRLFAHATSSLWTNVCIHDPSSRPEILNQILHYSKNRLLTACVVVTEEDVEFKELLNICIMELFCHSERICSFQLRVIGSQMTLWSENIPMPPFSRLEDFKTVLFISEQSAARLYQLFDSPRLQKVTCASQSRFPEPLLRMGAQIKELVFDFFFDSDPTRLAALLQACPNITNLNVRGSYPPARNHPIHLRNLHTFRIDGGGIYTMINAPNMRHLTLTLDVDNHHCDWTSLFQLLTLSPRIETLRINLELEDGAEETFDNLIFQITLLTPCVVTLEITFMSTPGIPVFDRLFMMLSRHNYGILAPVLPKLRHLTLNVEHFADDKPRAPPLTYSAGMLLRMLELRYSPNRKSPDDPPATAILQSCTLSDARYEENLIWWVTTRDEEIKRRLEALHAHGFELGGNVLSARGRHRAIGPVVRMKRYKDTPTVAKME